MAKPKKPQRAKCTGHNRNGKPCGKYPIKGGTVCSTHGGSAPQVKAAAVVRAAKLKAESEALRMVARAGVDADPIEHLIECLVRAAALVEVWGLMVAQLDDAARKENAETGRIRGSLSYGVRLNEQGDDDGLNVRSDDRLLALSSSGEARIHPFIREYHDALERRARFAKLCMDAGVEQQRAKLLEQQGTLIAQVIRAIVEDSEVGLSEKQRKTALVAGAKHLRLISGGAA